MPFVQGQLLERNLNCTVETECAISGREIVFEIAHDLSYNVRTSTDQPVLFIPMINLGELDAPSIVDDF